jgi:hypothetical protein
MSWNIRQNPFFPGRVERHDGIDLPYGMNEMINAKQDGVIKRISNDPNGYGNFVDILHDDGTTGRYAHAGIISRGEGQRVKRGDEIGLAGSTGRSTGPHLHFEHHDQSGRPMDPRPLLASVGGRAPTQFATGPQAAPTQNYGGPNMATALPLTMGVPPVGMEEYVRQAQSLIPQAKPTPELMAMMQQNAQRRVNNLPLAMGAMLSGDKGMAVLGGSMYKDGQEALNPQAIGEEGFFDPNSGQFVKNPVGDVKRNQKMLELAVGLSQRAQSDAIRQEQARTTQAFTQYIQAAGLQNQWDRLNNDQQQNFFNNWLASKGLELKIKADGRADDAQTNNQIRWADQPQATTNAPTAPLMSPVPAPTGPRAPVGVPVPPGAPQPPAPPMAPPQAAAPPVAPPVAPPPTAVPPVAPPPVAAPGTPAPFVPRVATQIPDHKNDGFTMDTGEPLLRVTKPGPTNGMLFVQRPDGFHTYDPSKGVLDEVTFRKQTEEVKTFKHAAKKAEELQTEIKNNPGAFDLVTNAAHKMLPQSVANQVTSLINKPENMALRARILKDASEEMSRLFGAAQSLGEAERASEFLITPTDGPQTILNKLEGGRAYAVEIQSRYGPAFIAAANRQLSGGSAATPQNAAPPSALPRATGNRPSPFKDPKNPTPDEIDADLKTRLRR